MPACPYSKFHENNSNPVSSCGKFYATCPICGRKALVVIHDKVDGNKSYSLVRIGRHSLQEFAKKVRTVRLSDRELTALEAGEIRLVVVNKRITVSV